MCRGRVVDQHVNFPISGNDFVHAIGPFVFARDVEPFEEDINAGRIDIGRDLSTLFFVDVGDADFGTFAREEPSRSGTYTARGAGYYGHLAFKSHSLYPFLLCASPCAD